MRTLDRAACGAAGRRATGPLPRGPATDRRGPRARSAVRGERAILCGVRRFVVIPPRSPGTHPGRKRRPAVVFTERNPELRERRRGEVANPGPGADPRKLELIGSARGSGGMIS